MVDFREPGFSLEVESRAFSAVACDCIADSNSLKNKGISGTRA